MLEEIKTGLEGLENFATLEVLAERLCRLACRCGDEFKELRKSAKIGRKELAIAANVEMAAIQRFERGIMPQRPYRSTIHLIKLYLQLETMPCK
jgi:hypothetical protein